MRSWGDGRRADIHGTHRPSVVNDRVSVGPIARPGVKVAQRRATGVVGLRHGRAVGVRLVRYASCDDDGTVELYVVFDADPGTPGEQGGGHTWPGSAFVIVPELEALVGIATQEISANDLMWDFFVANAPTKPAAVGGIALEADLKALPQQSRERSGPGVSALVGIAMAVAVAGVAGVAAWYARKRASAEARCS